MIYCTALERFFVLIFFILLPWYGRVPCKFDLSPVNIRKVYLTVAQRSYLLSLEAGGPWYCVAGRVWWLENTAK